MITYSLTDMLHRIKILKKEKKVSNERLSKISGISLGTLSKILAGQTKEPSIESIIKIAHALDVTADYLIFGEEPQTTTQDIYTFAEKAIIDKYRNLDIYGKKAVDSLLSVEFARITSFEAEKTKLSKKRNDTKYAQIMYYDTPVSAGVGEYLDDSNYIMLDVMEPLPDGAEYIVRVCGDSMEPTYKDGDKLFIKPQDDVEIGEVGIFLINNDVFVKERANNGLISHNDKYKPIYFQNEDVLKCFGKVVGICTKYR